MRSAHLVLGAVLASAPGATVAGVEAQDVQTPAPSARSFEVTPWIALLDDAYDIGADGSLGVLFGVRGGWVASERIRIIANLGYGEVEDVARVPVELTDYHVFANRWILTTAGVEFDIYDDGTELLASLQLGGGWRRVVATDTVGEPPDDAFRGDDGYAFLDALVPAIVARQEVRPGLALEAGIADYMFDILEASVDHSPVVWLGLVIR